MHAGLVALDTEDPRSYGFMAQQVATPSERPDRRPSESPVRLEHRRKGNCANTPRLWSSPAAAPTDRHRGWIADLQSHSPRLQTRDRLSGFVAVGAIRALIHWRWPACLLDSARLKAAAHAAIAQAGIRTCDALIDRALLLG